MSGVPGSRPWLAWLAFGLAIACGILGVALAILAGELRSRPTAHFADMRVAAINAQLAEAEPDYVLLAGDSHAEMDPVTRFCGRPVINAGVSGMRASEYAAVADRFRPVTPPALSVLTIGTNDLRVSSNPLDPATLARFDAAASTLVGRLRAMGGATVVTAVPPLDREVAKLDAAAVPTYAARLKALCDRLGCVFADPFRALRGADGRALPGTLRDGVHLRSYRTALAVLEGETCQLLPTR